MEAENESSNFFFLLNTMLAAKKFSSITMASPGKTKKLRIQLHGIRTLQIINSASLKTN